MNRQDLIKALTRYELDWYVHNSEGHEDETAEFFAKGGFNTYTDEQLADEYSKNIAPEAV
jgi:hypothetical protein